MPDPAAPSLPLDQPADVCIVIPAFREDKRIGVFLAELLGLIESEPLKMQVIVVDDGSGVEGQRALRAVLDPLRLIHPRSLGLLELPRNLGKGGAIKAGWDACPVCEYLAFADADGSITACEVMRLGRVAWAQRAVPKALFASRVKMLGKNIQCSRFRRFSGRTFSILVEAITGAGVYDSQCGCKFVPTSVYHAIRPVLQEQRFAFDVELMLAILRAGFAIEEIPIDWHATPGSKVSFLSDTCRMLSATVAIRRRALTWTFAEKKS